MFVNASNNAVAKLSSNINSSQTSLTVDDASIFPDAPFLVTVNNNRHNMEIMRVTNVGGNTLTVQRAQEGTTAQSHDAGSNVENNFTAGTYQALVDEIKKMQEIEFGENENGTYEKYPSGLLICRQTVSVGMSEGTGALFRSDAQLWEFPHEFISSDISVTFTTRVANRWGGTTGAINTDRVPYRIYGTTNTGEYLVILSAIGRWK